MKRHFLTLSPLDLFELAIGVEASNAQRFREWADRFRPFNVSVSVLLEDMAAHCDLQGGDLKSLQAGDIRGEATDRVSPAFREDVEIHTENAKGAGEHFFVVDRTMARSILTAAINALSKARYFYKTIAVTTRNLVLRKACEPRAVADIGNVGKLNDFLEKY